MPDRLRTTWVVCGFALGVCLVLAGCTSVVVGTPKAGKHGASNGPIFPSQLVDLLTPSQSLSVVSGSPLFEQDMQSALFSGADPAECQGVAGYGGYALFPKNYTGREARTQSDALQNQHQLLEVSATYPSGFNAASFLDSVRNTVSGCQHPITSWGNDQRKVTVVPAALQPSTAEVAQWSTKLQGDQWICDFAVIAMANVVSQIVTCSPDHSVDIKALVAKRIKKIEELINSTA
ncbi:hypothetical protein A9W99_01970 [Mycobacterium sp. 1164966.3]|nr:hypothetical protein A9W99_01970 [Mycobacterium sp. 1164966.3]